MDKFFTHLKITMWIASITVTAMVWVWSNIATITYVDAKHDSLRGRLAEITKTLRIIDERLYDLNKHAGPVPGRPKPEDD